MDDSAVARSRGAGSGHTQRRVRRPKPGHAPLDMRGCEGRRCARLGCRSPLGGRWTNHRARRVIVSMPPIGAFVMATRKEDMAQCDREIAEADRIIRLQEERIRHWRERLSFLSANERNATMLIRKV